MLIGATPLILDIIVPKDYQRQRSYPFPINYYFFDKFDYYMLTYTHIYCLGVHMVQSIVGIDVLIFVFAQHACGMLQVLRCRRHCFYLQFIFLINILKSSFGLNKLKYILFKV